MTNVFDGEKVHVQRAQCSTCIFRPGNLMHLHEGRVEEMVAECEQTGGVIPCHKTTHGRRKQESVCRGFFDLRINVSLRLAVAMDVIEWT